MRRRLLAWVLVLAMGLPGVPIPALAEERDQHWARVGAASFLTDAEKRAALGLPALPTPEG